MNRGRRSRVRWVYYADGPVGGRREPHGVTGSGDTIHYRERSIPGMVSVHEYRLTGEQWRGIDEWSGAPRTAHVARFVRTLADEPVADQSLHRLGGGGPRANG